MPDKSQLVDNPKLMRSSLPLVIAVFAAWTAGRAADAAVLPSLGYWGAFAIGLVTAAIVAGVVNAAVNAFISQRNH